VTPAVHELLQYLEAVEFPYSPRVLCFDAGGNEILSYIDGISGRNAWAMVVPEAVLTRLHSWCGRTMMRWGFRPTTAGWSGHRHDLGDDQLICHGDFGPWNSVWEVASPWVWSTGILRALGAGCTTSRTPWNTRRHSETTPSASSGWRTPALQTEPADWRSSLEPTDWHSTNGLVDEVIRVQEEQISTVQEFADAARFPQTEWVANGHLDVLGARAAWTQANRHLFETRGPGIADT
jgi:hypothetical protein